MADGTTKPIEDIEVGDWVWATDPETGETGPRQVVDSIVGDGEKQLVDIGVGGDVLTATDRHPFWVDNEGRWVDAGALEPGDRLLLADGSSAAVMGVDDRVEVVRVHNLTVEGIHTYFVEAGGAAVLVHNCRRPVSATRQQAVDNATDSSGVLRCTYCDDPLTTSPGSGSSLEFDHVVPYVDGGGRGIDNIVASCRTCNRSKGANDLADWLADL